PVPARLRGRRATGRPGDRGPAEARAGDGGAGLLHDRGPVADAPAEGPLERGIPHPPMMERPEAHEIVPELRPVPEDTVFVKANPSAFFGTELVGQLVFLSVDTLIVTGMTTSGCVRASVVDAFSHNFRVIVPEECVGDRGHVS